jgi:NADH dehydrogenase FAD-containing subunit
VLDKRFQEIEKQMAQPRIIIVGAGFGGLAAARALKKAPAEIIVIESHESSLISASALPGSDIGSVPESNWFSD